MCSRDKKGGVRCVCAVIVFRGAGAEEYTISILVLGQYYYRIPLSKPNVCSAERDMFLAERSLS